MRLGLQLAWKGRSWSLGAGWGVRGWGRGLEEAPPTSAARASLQRGSLRTFFPEGTTSVPGGRGSCKKSQNLTVLPLGFSKTHPVTRGGCRRHLSLTGGTQHF